MQEHGRHRADAELVDCAAGIEIGTHPDLRDRARVQLELIRARHAGAVEQRIDREEMLVGLGAQQPEVGEIGELLSRFGRGINGEPTGRDAVGLVTGQQTEVGGAEEHQHLVLVGRRVERIVHPEACEPKLGGQLHRRHTLAEFEHCRIVGNGAHGTVHHLVDIHAVVIRKATMKELHFEHRVVVPQCAHAAKTDVAVLFIAQFRQHLRQFSGAFAVSLGGAILRQALHALKGEWLALHGRAGRGWSCCRMRRRARCRCRLRLGTGAVLRGGLVAL